jgi:hypothetical protein
MRNVGSEIPIGMNSKLSGYWRPATRDGSRRVSPLLCGRALYVMGDSRAFGMTASTKIAQRQYDPCQYLVIPGPGKRRETSDRRDSHSAFCFLC